MESGEALFRVENGKVRQDELAALAAVFLALSRGGGPAGVPSADRPPRWRLSGRYVAPGSWR
ncbi:acyl-CoA carboxylase epsilon subunit [Streptomyces prasinus]|uniref:acyl-CoA carboxylase epsilon subunit n=1 Tax=Streptomyces prasinus TaxID=67345 RepID=UPI0006EB4813|nr:acyl-CoA carboxylase epsilon subunit [Streptomyces prasinus]